MASQRSLVQASRDLIAVTISELNLANTDWERFGVRDTQYQLKGIEWMLSPIAERRVVVPDPQNAESIVNQIRETISEIDSFNLNTQSKADRDDIQSRLDSLAGSLLQEVGLLSLMTRQQSISDPSGEAKVYIERLREAVEEARSYRADAERSAEAAQATSAATRLASGDAGAKEMTTYFLTEAGQMKATGIRWLRAASLLAAGTLLLALYFVFFDSGPSINDGDGWLVLYGLGGRIFALSLLTYAVTWTGRMSAAGFHGWSLNRHRAASLQTLSAFKNAPTDKSTQDAVALAGARAVFENLPTGYLSKPESSSSVGQAFDSIQPLKLGQSGDS